jgi:hypothetical protein
MAASTNKFNGNPLAVDDDNRLVVVAVVGKMEALPPRTRPKESC